MRTIKGLHLLVGRLLLLMASYIHRKASDAWRWVLAGDSVIHAVKQGRQGQVFLC